MKSDPGIYTHDQFIIGYKDMKIRKMELEKSPS